VFTVALVGADGAGKTTIARRLENSSALPIKYMYMGVSPIASNYALPTTRAIAALKRMMGQNPDMAGPPDPTRKKAPPRNPVKRALKSVKSSAQLANRVAEQWYRQLLAWYFQRRGYIVLFDRHFFADYYAHDVAVDGEKRSAFSRLHGYLLNHVYPKPQLIIFLDAPASVLLERKGEGTLELLEHRRQEYLQLQGQVAHFARVDAARPLEDVEREVVELLWEFKESRKPERVS